MNADSARPHSLNARSLTRVSGSGFAVRRKPGTSLMRMTNKILIAICLLTLAPSAAPASRMEDSGERTDSMVEKKIRVLVLVNAGEPDPSWEISDDGDLSYVRKSLNNLRSAREPVWPSLGWRGFQLVNEGVSGFPDAVQVFKGVIRIRDGAKTSYFRDDHGLEKWLEQQAKKHGISVG